MHAATTAVRSGDMILTFSLPLDANVPSSAVTLQSAAGVVPTTFTTNGNQIIVTPSQRLLPVMSHTLTVGTQIRGSGGEQMTAPAVVSFTTADAVWGQAQIIETSMGSLSTPRLAVSPSGEAIAVWQDTSLGNQLHHTVAMNRYVAGAGWGPIPQHIAFSAPGGTIAGVQLALAASGDAIAVWAQDDDGDGSGVPSARANPRAAGTDWNHNDAMFLGSSTMRAENPHIALNARGNGVAVWQQRDASLNMNIWSRHYSSSNGWGVPTPIETSVSEAVSPRVAVADNGDAIVVWLELDDGYYSLWANRFAAAAGWSGAVLIETHTGQVVAPDIAMSSTGDAIVVWRSNSAGDNSIWANHYVVGRGWDDAVELGTPTTFTSSPHVALGADGNAIVVWGQREGTRYSVWSIRYAVGQGWGAPGLLETDDSGDAGGAQIAIDSRGNAIAVWAQYDGSRANLWARRYVAGSTWLAPTLIETDDAGDVGALQIGFDASGNAIAVWHQDDGQRFNIWANRFE